jgi:hypothetical protein
MHRLQHGPANKPLNTMQVLATTDVRSKTSLPITQCFRKLHSKVCHGRFSYIFPVCSNLRELVKQRRTTHNIGEPQPVDFSGSIVPLPCGYSPSLGNAGMLYCLLCLAAVHCAVSIDVDVWQDVGSLCFASQCLIPHSLLLGLTPGVV